MDRSSRDKIRRLHYKLYVLRGADCIEVDDIVQFRYQPVDMSTYFKIVNGLMEIFMEKVYAGNFVKLGAKLGTVGIMGKKHKPRIDENTGKIYGLCPDYVGSKKIWGKAAEEMGLTLKEYTQKVPFADRPTGAYHFNEHSNGYGYSLYWFRGNGAVAHKSQYTLRFAFDIKRAVSTHVFAGVEYLTSDTAKTKAPYKSQVNIIFHNQNV